MIENQPREKDHTHKLLSVGMPVGDDLKVMHFFILFYFIFFVGKCADGTPTGFDLYKKSLL